MTRYLALPLSVLAAMGIGILGCGGGSGPGPTPNPIIAEFYDNGTQAAPDLVRLTGQAAGDTLVVDVVLGGATTSNDLYSFAFDLLIDEVDTIRYVGGSAVAGDALSAATGQQIEVLATQVGERLTVGVTKLGGGPGNGVDSTEATVISFSFVVLKRNRLAEIRIAGSPPNGPAALDSGGIEIDSVIFDTASVGVMGY